MSRLQDAVLQGFMIFALTTVIAQIEFATAPTHVPSTAHVPGVCEASIRGEAQKP